jgi:hypothetical protein
VSAHQRRFGTPDAVVAWSPVISDCLVSISPPSQVSVLPQRFSSPFSFGSFSSADLFSFGEYHLVSPIRWRVDVLISRAISANPLTHSFQLPTRF